MAWNDATLAAHLQAGEDVLWSGPFRPKSSALALSILASVLTALVLWLGWSDASPFHAAAPWIASGLATLLAAPFALFALITTVDRLNAGSAHFTSLRILNINRTGRLSPESGYVYDFTRPCTVTENGAKSALDVPVVAIERGYPDMYSLGQLAEDTAIALAGMMADLGEKTKDRGDP